jgi:hypothetical protein
MNSFLAEKRQVYDVYGDEGLKNGGVRASDDTFAGFTVSVNYVNLSLCYVGTKQANHANCISITSPTILMKYLDNSLVLIHPEFSVKYWFYVKRYSYI